MAPFSLFSSSGATSASVVRRTNLKSKTSSLTFPDNKTSSSNAAVAGDLESGPLHHRGSHVVGNGTANGIHNSNSNSNNSATNPLGNGNSSATTSGRYPFPFSRRGPNRTNPRRKPKSQTSRFVCCGVMPLDLPVVGVVVFWCLFGAFLVVLARSTLGLPWKPDPIFASEHGIESSHLYANANANAYSPSHQRRQQQAFEEGISTRHHQPSKKQTTSDSHHSDANPHPISDSSKSNSELPPAATLPVRLVRSSLTEHQDTVVDYDLVVAGAGPAGLTAALFASRAGLSVYVLGSPSTGLLSQTKRLDNFPSFVDVDKQSDVKTGPQWLESTLAQAQSWGATFAPPGLLATSLERQRMVGDEDQDASALDATDSVASGEIVMMTTDSSHAKDVHFALSTTATTADPTTHNTVRAWSVVVASGATPRTLGLPGEDRLWGVSMHTCAICDGHLYASSSSSPKNNNNPKTVLVVGGGDAALDAALQLARYASEVLLVHRRNDFSRVHNSANLAVARSTLNIRILTPYTVRRWITADDDPSQLVGVELEWSGNPIHGNSQEKNKIESIDGAFVTIGATPNTGWIGNHTGLVLDEEGLISTAVDGHGKAATATSIPGLFAAGEVTDNVYKQAITAAAAGAQAAMDAERWLREQRGIASTTPNANANAKAATNNENADANANANAKSENSESANTADKSKEQTRSQGKDPTESQNNGTLDCDMTVPDCIQFIVGAHPVVVFSKPWCPYCRKALEALSRAGLSKEEIHVIDLSEHSDSQHIQSTLQGLTGRRTVPNVFVGGKSIGGGDETHGFQQRGELVPMLVEAGALPTESPEHHNAQATKEKAAISKIETRAAPRKEIGEHDTKAVDKTESSDLHHEGKLVPFLEKAGALGLRHDKVETGTASHKQTSQHQTKALDEDDEDESDDWKSSSKTESCDMALESCIRSLILENPLLMFSLSWCPECKQLLELLDTLGVSQSQIHIVDLDDYDSLQGTIRGHMKTLTGRRSVPNLFVGGEYVGGFMNTYDLLYGGKLVPMLEKAGALGLKHDGVA